MQAIPALNSVKPRLTSSWYPARLRRTRSFTPPAQPLTRDSLTVGLYSFNEGAGDVVYDTGGYDGGTSNGWVVVGSSPAGPAWTTAVPYVEQQHIYLPIIQR